MEELHLMGDCSDRLLVIGRFFRARGKGCGVNYFRCGVNYFRCGGLNLRSLIINLIELRTTIDAFDGRFRFEQRFPFPTGQIETLPVLIVLLLARSSGFDVCCFLE